MILNLTPDSLSSFVIAVNDLSCEGGGVALMPIPLFARGILVKHDLDFNTHLNWTFIAFNIWVIPFIDFSFDGWCGSNVHTSKLSLTLYACCIVSKVLV